MASELDPAIRKAMPFATLAAEYILLCLGLVYGFPTMLLLLPLSMTYRRGQDKCVRHASEARRPLLVPRLPNVCEVLPLHTFYASTLGAASLLIGLTTVVL